MNNILTPIPCQILNVVRESSMEYTFRVKSDMKPEHGQFMQLSIPRIGEAPISVSASGEDWLEFTIRAVGKVTDEIFQRGIGDVLFLRGPYGNGWPIEKFQNKHMVIITGGTGLAPVRSILHMFDVNPEFVKSVTLISGFKNKDSILFRTELDQWRKNKKFTVWYTLDKDQIPGWNVGYVTEYVSKIPFENFEDAYEVVIVGPPPMMKFTGIEVAKRGVPENKIWMSFERRMSCAVGKCGHCRIDETYVCLEGPVFPYSKAKYLVD